MAQLALEIFKANPAQPKLTSIALILSHGCRNRTK